jgi:hypothetical protein
MTSLHEKNIELKRQIDQLDRRLKDRSEIVEVKLSFFLFLDHPKKTNIIEMISYTLISNLREND